MPNHLPENDSSAAGAQQESLTVGRSIKERRLDKYLHGRFSNLSRVMIQKQIAAGLVLVNGSAVKSSFRLSPGDRIDLELPRPQPTEIVAQDIPLDIVYEDEEMIVVNKPSDMIVHPARGHNRSTLVNALAFHCEKLSPGLGELRPGIVHRLDRNTTGVLVATKNAESQWKIAKQFENRTVEKRYLAVVHGCPELDADKINASLGVHPRAREKYAVRAESLGGKDAVTFYRVIERFRGYSLVEASPRTGRTHQIRVHLSHIKHPVVADDMYGGKPVWRWQLADAEPSPEEPLIGRCALHAFSLTLTHPSSGRKMTFEAPLAADMAAFLEALRMYRRPAAGRPAVFGRFPKNQTKTREK